MIVQGKKGTYDVRIRPYGYSRAAVSLYTPPKKLFGMIPLPQRLIYEEERAAYTVTVEGAMDMSDEDRLHWVMRVVDWYENRYDSWKALQKR